MVNIFGFVITFSKAINSLGLLLDILGALMIFRYGLPEQIDKHGYDYLVSEQESEEEQANWKTYDRLAKIGAGTLVSGFALQLLSNFF